MPEKADDLFAHPEHEDLPPLSAMVVGAPTAAPDLVGAPAAQYAGDAAQATSPAPDLQTGYAAGAPPDTPLTPRVPALSDPNLDQNVSESSAGVSSAGPRAETVHPLRSSPDTPLRAPSADHWTPAERLEFMILWRAIELRVAEIAAHFGLSVRHLQRLRADFGLDVRPALRRLDRPARRRLVAFEAMAAFMTPRGRTLLEIAHARRRVQDEARDAAEADRAKRRWLRKRATPRSADAKRLVQRRRRLRLF